MPRGACSTRGRKSALEHPANVRMTRGLSKEELTVTRTFRPLIVLAFLMSSACSGDGATGPSELISPSTLSDRSVPVTRPAGGSCTINGQFLQPASGTVATFHATGVCNLQHLGRTTIVIDQFFFADGSVTNSTVHTAANGDLLNSTWLSPPGSSSVVGLEATFAGTETYNSGTGRFANVSGSSFVEGSAHLTVTGSFTAESTSIGSMTF